MKEKDVERQIVDLALVMGFHVTELSQRRRGKCPRCGMPIYAGSQQTEGVPDLYLSHPKRKLRLWVEVKGTKTRVTDAQKAWHQREREAGGRVFVVRSVEDFLAYLEPFGFEATVRP